MNGFDKISPAFGPFMDASGPKDRREAIVVYRAPKVDKLPVRGRLLKLQQRLDYVKSRAAVQQPVEKKLFQAYRKAGKKRLGGTQELAVSSIGSRTLPVAMVEVTRKTLPALAEQADVVAVMPNQPIQLIRPKAIDYEELGRQEIRDGLTWGLKQLNVPKMWETTRGQGVNVAVMDTGVYAAHPVLNDRVSQFTLVDGPLRRIKAEPAFDVDSHGTHVCGTIAGGKIDDKLAIGVAPEAKLLVAGILLGGATLKMLFEGLAWAIENGAHIINMSLGFTYYEPKFVEVFDMLIQQYGILPVAAIGNENHGNSSSPGNAASALSVGAVEKIPRGKTEVTFFSGGASLVFPGQEPNGLVTKPDVVAPGAQVLSCIPPTEQPDGMHHYTYMGGTSMAAPHVSGVAALLMSGKPEAPVTDIIDVLKQTAKHPEGADRRPDNRWGFGLIRPVEALEAL